MSGSNDTIANDKIDSKLRTTIKSKNDSLLNAMSNSDLKAYKALASEKFIKHLQAKTRNFVWLYRVGYLDNKYTIFDEFYNNSSKPLVQIKIASEKNGYSFSFVNEDKETYVSVLKTSLYQNDYLLIVTYGRTDKGWRITDIEASMFGHYGKTAKEYYEMAQQREKDGKLIDAVLYADLAVASIKESETMVKFDDEENMEPYQSKLRSKLNEKYKFPRKLDGIDTQPEIMNIEYKLTKEGMFPMIVYKTTIPVKDEEKLKTEYEQVKTKAKSIFIEMDFNKQIVFYKAYNVLPNKIENTQDPFHEFEDRK